MRIIVISLFILINFSLNAQNNSINFSGDDRVRILNAMTSGDLTIELWFKNDATTICPNSAILLGMGPANNLSLCGGNLYFNTVNIGGIGTNDWHHLAITVNRISNSLSIFLDCISIYTQAIPNPTFFSGLFIGNKSTAIISPDGWVGKIDEVRVWNTIKTSQQLEEAKHCPCSGDEPNLRICMPFDEIINNQTPDYSSIAGINNGLIDINGVGGQATISNIIAPMLYPHFNNTHIFISPNFSPSDEISEICNGNNMHFSLKDHNGIQVLLNSGVPNVTTNFYWEVYDPLILGFKELPPDYFGVAFPVDTMINCALNNQGFEEIKYRVRIKVKDVFLQDSCWYTSDTVSLKICCPIDQNTSLNFNANSGNSICETDNGNLMANIISTQSFVNNPGPELDICWEIDGNLYPIYDDFLSISIPSYNFNAPRVCVKVKIQNCGCDFLVLEKCIDVDQQPVCDGGEIVAMDGSVPGSVLLVAPHKYEICPETDAILKMVDPTKFMNGNATWQYRFTSPNFSGWVNMGVSNNEQNTNVLPIDDPLGSPDIWPSNQKCIEYRIANVPYNSPSGCDTCFSNIIKICINDDTNNSSLSGPDKFCSGGNAQLSLSNYDNTLNYIWYHNGVPIANNVSTFNATEGGCYWVEIRNRCGIVNTTNKHCIEECVIIPIISCPLPDNPCACSGQPIKLSGCDSQDSCDEGPLTYTWSFNNGTQISTSNHLCDFEHIPDDSSTTYTLTVTNALGCSASISKTIIPCQN